jgi:hypothetical protein
MIVPIYIPLKEYDLPIRKEKKRKEKKKDIRCFKFGLLMK